MTDYVFQIWSYRDHKCTKFSRGRPSIKTINFQKYFALSSACVNDVVKGSKDQKDDKHQSFRGLTSLLFHTSYKNYPRTDTIKNDEEASISREEAGPFQLRHQLQNLTLRIIILLYEYIF